MDVNTQAARVFYKLVRKFAETSNATTTTAVFYDVLPDEAYDLSLVSQRVYGSRDEFLAVLAAAGLDTFDQPLTQRTLVLPNAGQLNVFKRQAGFESIADLRINGAPMWSQA